MASRFIDYHPANTRGYHSIHRYLFDSADNEFLISYAKNKKFEKPLWMSNANISSRMLSYSTISSYLRLLSGDEDKCLTTFSKGVKHFGRNLLLSRKDSQDSRKESPEESLVSPSNRRRTNRTGVADNLQLISPTKFKPKK